ncbi:MAG: CARDB domain-containing protein [archaeon]
MGQYGIIAWCMVLSHKSFLLAITALIFLVFIISTVSAASVCRNTADPGLCSYNACFGDVSHYAKNECLRSPATSSCVWKNGWIGYGCYDQKCYGSCSLAPAPTLTSTSATASAPTSTPLGSGAGNNQPQADATPPTAATIAAISTYNSNSVLLNWTASPATDPETGIANYYVWSNTNGSAFTNIATRTSAQTTYDATALVDGNHGFFVQAINGEGMDSNSNTRYSFTDSTAPTQATLSTPPVNNLGTVDLNWTASPSTDAESGINQYNIFYNTNGSAFTLLGSTTDTNYLATLLADGNHGFFIQSLNNAGSDSNSAVVYSDTNTALPVAPILVTLPVFNTGEFSLNWSSNPGSDSVFGVARYVVWQNYNGSAFTQIANTTSFTYSVAGRQTLDGNYGYFVQLVGNSARDANSAPVYSYMDSSVPIVNSINDISDGNVQYAPFTIDFNVSFGVSGIGTSKYRLKTAPWSIFTADLNALINIDGNNNFDYNFCNLAGACTSGTTMVELDTGYISATPTNPGASAWQRNAFNVSFDVDFGYQGRASARYALDNGSWQNFFVDFNVPITTDGNHQLDYNFCNNAGFCDTNTLYTLFDNTAPTVNSITNPGALWQTAPFTVTFDINFDLAGRNAAAYRINNGAWNNFVTDLNFLVNADGNHKVDYNFTDVAGNSLTGTIYSALDLGTITAPTISALSIYNNGNILIDWFTSPGSAGASGLNAYNVWSSTDGVAFALESSTTDTNYTDTLLLDGNHIYFVQITNNAGLDANSTIINSLTDTTAPIVNSIANPGASAWRGADFNVTFDVNFDYSGRGIATTQYKINGGAWTPFGTDLNALVNVDGNNTVDYNFCDNANNCTTGTLYAALDRNYPVIVSITNPGTIWQNADFNVTFDVNYGISDKNSAQYMIDSSAWTDFVSDYNILIATDGNHRIDYSFCNNANNCTSGTIYSALDRSAPSAAVLPDLNTFNFGNIDLNWTLTPAGDLESGIASYAVWRNMDGNTFILIGSTTDTNYADTTLVDGNYGYFVQAINGANLDANSNIVYTMTELTAPLDFNVLALPAYNSGLVTVIWNATTDPQSGVDHYNIWHTMDLNNYDILGPTTDTNFDLNFLVEGTHYIFIQAINGVGYGKNTNTVSTITDLTAPTLVITNSGASAWQGYDYNVHFDVNFEISGIALAQYTFDGNTYDLNAMDYNALVNVDGNSVMGYHFCDNAGNCADANITVLLDRTPPIAAQFAPINPFNTGTVDLNWTTSPGSDSLSGILNYVLWMSIDGNTYSNMYSGTDTNMSFIGLIADTNYRYILQTFNGAMLDSNSNMVSSYVDLNAPVITSVTPADDTNTTVIGAQIIVNYTDISGANPASVVMYLDGNIIVPQYVGLAQIIYTSPVNIALGTHDVNISFRDNMGNGPVDYNWDYNIVPIAAHDLRVVNVNAPTIMDVNTSTTISMTVHNDGDAVENSTIGIFLNGAQVYSAPLTLVYNQTSTFTYNWTPATIGTYTIVATIAGVASETILIDNNASTSTIVELVPPTILPDFRIIDLTFSNNTPVEGNPLTINALVQNNSLSVYNGSLTVGFYNSLGMITQTTQVVSISAGGTALISGAWNTTGQAGVNNVMVTADDGNLVGEESETNNDVNRTIIVAPAASIVAPGYDLVASIISVTPSSVFDGNIVTLDANVVSYNASIMGVRVTFTVDGVDVNSRTLTLVNGIGQNISFTWNAVSGTHTLAVIVDSAYVFDENNETNNAPSVVLNVSPAGGIVPNGYNQTIVTYIYNGTTPTIDEEIPEDTNTPTEEDNNNNDGEIIAAPDDTSPLGQLFLSLANLPKDQNTSAFTALFALITTPEGMGVVGMGFIILVLVIAAIAFFVLNAAPVASGLKKK